MNRLHCWWDGFYGTWLSPGTWGVRLRLLSQGAPVSWPGIVEDGHVYEMVKRFEVEGDREIEYMRCARCRAEIQTGWRRYYGQPRP